MVNKKRVGEYIKKLRMNLKREDGKSYTQNNIAELFSSYAVNISTNAIEEWESGKTLPSLENLDVLADIFNKSIDEILDAEDRKDINYEEIYFLANDDWMSKHSENNLYQVRNEQIKLITSRFKELLNIRIDRDFTHNEEEEFGFLFNNFYILSDYARDYSNIDVNNDYLIFKNAINELLVQIRNMDNIEKYWELQKLYSESKKLWFSFWSDVHDLRNVTILKERFDLIEDWQKDMLLAMYQNIEPYTHDPTEFGSDDMKRYEERFGEYDHDKLRRSEIKELINRGACLNKCFFNVKEGSFETKRIIDRLEELYNLCLKPIEVHMLDENGKGKVYKIENNQRNRFLNEYYFKLDLLLNGYQNSSSGYESLEDVYNWFINNDEITEDIYLKIAQRENIDTNKDKKYWMADVKSSFLNEKVFYEYKEKEKRIADGLKEIEELKAKLEAGDFIYRIHKYEIIGGNDEESIRDYIEYWKADLTYSEFLKGRDKELTQQLLNEIDNLSFEEIRSKYFKIEVVENE